MNKVLLSNLTPRALNSLSAVQDLQDNTFVSTPQKATHPQEVTLFELAISTQGGENTDCQGH